MIPFSIGYHKCERRGIHEDGGGRRRQIVDTREVHVRKGG